jgi:hypothetical protein
MNILLGSHSPVNLFWVYEKLFSLTLGHKLQMLLNLYSFVDPGVSGEMIKQYTCFPSSAYHHLALFDVFLNGRGANTRNF